MKASLHDNPPNTGSLWETLFLRSIPLERETMLFVLVSTLDIVMTWLLLWHSAQTEVAAVFYESNPIAAYFFHGWGLKGLVGFKYAMVAFVACITQVIFREKPATARRLLNFAIILVSGVVIYGLVLYLHYVELFV